jgi:hypothetical protein
MVLTVGRGLWHSRWRAHPRRSVRLTVIRILGGVTLSEGISGGRYLRDDPGGKIREPTTRL